MSAPQVPGLSDDWAPHQLALDLEAAMGAVRAAPYQPDPPLCRLCPCVRGRRCLLDVALEQAAPGSSSGNETVTTEGQA